ncbi:MAG: phosphatase PAP2 family protein [Bacteroidales bacterium]|nr:phosphatase PAP2 family protein [Bacteroidales bacterium]
MRKKLFPLFLALAVLLPNVLFAQQKIDESSYFKKEELPNALHFLPAPPDTCTTQFMYDISQYMWGKTQRAGERGERARREAATDIPTMLKLFSGAFGYDLSPETTPAIYRVVAKACNTSHDAGSIPKRHYMRKRPYMRFNEPTLVPEDEEILRTNGSYPSGHTLLGWGMALILSEINPSAQDTLLAMGYEWGQSRVIAGFHWQSDVDASRMLAAAVIARLHTSEAFLNDMRRAREEWAKIKKSKK